MTAFSKIWIENIKSLDALIIPIIGDFNGTDYLTNGSIIGTETVVSSIGTSIPSVSAGRIDFTSGSVSYLELDNGSIYVFCEGVNSDYVYDVSGNAVHLTWNATGNKYIYASDGSLHPLNNGVNIYKNTGDLARIPYTVGKIAITTPVTSGYTLQSEHPFKYNLINMLDCIIDFDYLDTLDSDLDNYDRSNVTIFDATARSASDYDASNPYRVQIDNLFNVEEDWKNTGYKYMVFLSETKDEGDNIIYFGSALNYATNKTSAADRLRINKFLNNYINHLVDNMATQL